MSSSHLFLKSGFLHSTLGNGIGRYVCQLQRLTFKFCKSTGPSKGVRDFIQSDLLDYAKNNPGVVVYLKPRRHRSPRVIAEYLNGHRELISLDDFSKEDVYRWSEYLRMREGAALTIAALGRGLWHMQTGNAKKSQVMMRGRILAQGFTVLALVAGVFIASQKSLKK